MIGCLEVVAMLVPVTIVAGITAAYWGTALGWMGLGTLIGMALLFAFHPGGLDLFEWWRQRRMR